MAKKKPKSEPVPAVVGYDGLLSGISEMLEQARRATVRVVNSTMTAAYWEIGRRIVEHEQRGEARAEYGEELLLRLGRDLTARFGRGFADRSLRKMRAFYLGWEIWPTPSANLQAKVKFQTVSGKSTQAIWPTPLAKSESEISPTPSAKL